MRTIQSQLCILEYNFDKSMEPKPSNDKDKICQDASSLRPPATQVISRQLGSLRLWHFQPRTYIRSRWYFKRYYFCVNIDKCEWVNSSALYKATSQPTNPRNTCMTIFFSACRSPDDKSGLRSQTSTDALRQPMWAIRQRANTQPSSKFPLEDASRDSHRSNDGSSSAERFSSGWLKRNYPRWGLCVWLTLSEQVTYAVNGL